jgi:ABC-type nitrate/sulfonate/bicarbonate transport system substrate-binding protein
MDDVTMNSGCLGAGLVAAAILAATSATSAEPLDELSIGLGSGSLVAGSARIAEELGIFEDHGFDVKLTVMDSGAAALAALIGGSFKVAVGGPSDFIMAVARGQDLLAVVPVYNGLGVNLVLSKSVADATGVSPAAPVEERLAALDGLLIGTTSPTTVATTSLQRAAAAVGVDVRFTYLTQQNFYAALTSGAIQGHIGGAPFWAPSIVSGAGVPWISGSRGEFPAEFTPSISSLVATTRKVAEAEPDLVERIAAVYVDLGEAVEERPDEVRAAIAKLYPTLDQPTINLLFESETGSWKTGPVTAGQMAHEIAYLKSIGTASVADLDGIDPAALLFFE